MAWYGNALPQGYDIEYNPYGYGVYTETEEDKLQREKEEKERVKAIKENRLYLEQVKQQCDIEELVNLKRTQLFLFEVIIERLEVKGSPTLGILSEDQESRVNTKIQFLNSPPIEICENPIEMPENKHESHFSNYFETLEEAKRKDIFISTTGSPLSDSQPDEADTDFPVIKWETPVGKSLLFSKSVLELIHDLEKYPVVVQVLRCAKDSSLSDPIGYARVRLPDDFSISIIQSCKAGISLPVTSVHEEITDIVNVFNIKKGRLELHFSLSSFGPVIYTSVQSVNNNRKYVFKPGPEEGVGELEKEDCDERKRSEILKPVITEEEKTVGISVLRDYDIFQIPVLWKSCSSKVKVGEDKHVLHNECKKLNKEIREPNLVSKCCCKKSPPKNASTIPDAHSSELPMSSKIDLCRNALPPTARKCLRSVGKAQCDWHNLVCLEIANSPVVNCGCLVKDFNDVSDYNKKSSYDTSNRVEAPNRSLTSIGIKPKKDNCFCNCPLLKKRLHNKQLFPI